MTREEKIKGLYSLKEYLVENPIELEGHKSLPITLIDYAIEALEKEYVTWIVGNDNVQIAVRNMPVDMMQKINAIIGNLQEPTTHNNCAERHGCITCSLDDGDDCCRKLYEESMQESTIKNNLAQERYQDLIEYFGDNETAKTILEDKKEFKAWLERVKWHVKRADELARELEQIKGTTKNDLGVDTDKLIADCEKMSFDFELFGRPTKALLLDAVKNIVKDLPSVTPQEPRWILVSEKLPNDRDWYLGIFKEPDTGWINPLPFICDYVGRETKATTKEYWILRGFTDRDYKDCDYYYNLECVAWMPLPQNYEEVEE